MPVLICCSRCGRSVQQIFVVGDDNPDKTVVCWNCLSSGEQRGFAYSDFMDQMNTSINNMNIWQLSDTVYNWATNKGYEGSIVQFNKAFSDFMETYINEGK